MYWTPDLPIGIWFLRHPPNAGQAFPSMLLMLREALGPNGGLWQACHRCCASTRSSTLDEPEVQSVVHPRPYLFLCPCSLFLCHDLSVWGKILFLGGPTMTSMGTLSIFLRIKGASTSGRRCRSAPGGTWLMALTIALARLKVIMITRSSPIVSSSISNSRRFVWKSP